MIKPLIINRCCYFDQSPGGECLRAFLESMDKDEWAPVVFASDMAPLVESVPEYAKLTHEKRYVQYVAAAIRRVLVPDLTWLPGYEWPAWGRGVVKEVLKNIKSGNIAPDYIHSVAFPIASHWAALKVKKKTGLPLVIQFYDPWADNPYRPFKTKWLKKMDYAMERECVEAADLIIHNNESIVKLWLKRYGKEIGEKMVVLPLTTSIPFTNLDTNAHKRGSVLTISHIGNFMLNRTSVPFIKAVAEVIYKYPEYRTFLRINYVGMVTEQEVELINSNKLTDIFNIVGCISADACIEYYKNSDIFLAIDGENNNNLFFPSKLLKYYFFQRPILGITPSGSVLDIELKKNNHRTFINNDIAGISDYILKAITNYESLCNFNIDYYKQFLPLNILKNYKTIIDNLLNKKMR